MTEPRWVPLAAVYAIQAALIAEHGGLQGVRDKGLLESALARPRQKLADGEPGLAELAELAELAAAYGFGLCRNYPFHDGNERIALAVVDVFLQMNGEELTSSEEDAVVTIRELALGTIGEEELTEWIRKNSAPLPVDD